MRSASTETSRFSAKVGKNWGEFLEMIQPLLATGRKTPSSIVHLLAGQRRTAELAHAGEPAVLAVPLYHDDVLLADSALRVRPETVRSVDAGPALDVDQIRAQLGGRRIGSELSQRVDQKASRIPGADLDLVRFRADSGEDVAQSRKFRLRPAICERVGAVVRGG